MEVGNKNIIKLINQLFELEQKVSKFEGHTIKRNIDRIKDLIEDGEGFGASYSYHNPLGEDYNETRIDCDASIAGESIDNLIISEVIKPIIRIHMDNSSKIIQRAIVIVKSKND